MVDVHIKKLDERAVIPEKGTDRSSGFDLYAIIDDQVGTVIKPGETAIIHTGIAIETPDGYFGAVAARSGISIKRGLRPANCVGVIDPDYRGEVLVGIHNDSNRVELIEDGERIAQLIFIPYLDVNFIEVDELDSTERGEGRLGSTGRK